jgi:hypothetical protein
MPVGNLTFQHPVHLGSHQVIHITFGDLKRGVAACEESSSTCPNKRRMLHGPSDNYKALSCTYDPADIPETLEVDMRHQESEGMLSRDNATHYLPHDDDYLPHDDAGSSSSSEYPTDGYNAALSCTYDATNMHQPEPGVRIRHQESESILSCDNAGDDDYLPHDGSANDNNAKTMAVSCSQCSTDKSKIHLKNVLDLFFPETNEGDKLASVFNDRDFDPRIFLFDTCADDVPLEVIDEQIRFLKKYPFDLLSWNKYHQESLQRFAAESLMNGASVGELCSATQPNVCEPSLPTALECDTSMDEGGDIFCSVDYEPTDSYSSALCPDKRKAVRCSMSLSLSPKYFIHHIQNDGKRVQSYGWNHYKWDENRRSELHINTSIRLEDVLSDLGLHQKRRFDNKSKLFGKQPKMLKAFENKKDVYEVAIYLGKLTVASDPSWEGSVFLYINVGMKEQLMTAAINVVQENINEARRHNNALRKRLKKLSESHQTIYYPAAVLSVEGVEFWFEAVNASLPPDVSSHNDEFLFIAFKESGASNYNAVFSKIAFAFNQVKTLQPPIKQVANHDLPRTVVYLSEVAHKRLLKTTAQMDIPDCSEIFQVSSVKPNDRGMKRVCESVFDDLKSSDNDTDDDDDDDADTDNTVFPEDPELKLLNWDNKEDLFAKEIRITTLSRIIQQLKSKLNEIQDPRFRTFCEGIIAALFYSNLRWRLSQVDPVGPSLVNRSVSVDIDQVSLDVNFIGNSSRFTQRQLSNNQYLKALCDKLVDQVSWSHWIMSGFVNPPY